MDLNHEVQQDLAIARTKIHHHLNKWASWGVDRTWINGFAWTVGADPVLGRSKNEYRINIAITGNYGRRVSAYSRTQALEQFRNELDRVLAKGKITADGSYDNVYRVQVADGAAPVFYSGPEDPITEPSPNLDMDGLRAAVKMLAKQGVADKNLPRHYADELLTELGMDKLPERRSYVVQVPVTGTAKLTVQSWEDEGEAGATVEAGIFMERAAKGQAGSISPGVLVVPEEVGEFTVVAESKSEPTEMDELDGEEGDNWSDGDDD